MTSTSFPSGSKMATVVKGVLAGLLAVAIGAIVALGTFVLVMSMTPPDCPRNEGPYRSLVACVMRPQGPIAFAVILGLIAVVITAFALRRWLSKRPAREVR